MPRPALTLTTYLSALLPPLIWASIIFMFSAQSVLPGFELSLYDFLLKKSAHIFVYLVLYLLVYRALLLLRAKPATQLWLPLLICLLYAISDEYHQSLTPGRFPSPRDVGFDMLGASLGFLKMYDYI